MIRLKSLINEIGGAKNFWVLPDGKIVECKDHVDWFMQNVESELEFDGDYPIKSDGSIAEPSDVYEVAFALGYVRLVKEAGNKPMLMDFDAGKPPTNLQLRNIRDFCIEHHWHLAYWNNRREIDLL